MPERSHNNGKHIVSIIDRQPCEYHEAPRGTPCYRMLKSRGNGYYPGICNRRAVKAGANGKITETDFWSNRKRY